MIKEWWFIIAFSISALGGLYKMSQTLNETKKEFDIIVFSIAVASTVMAFKI